MRLANSAMRISATIYSPQTTATGLRRSRRNASAAGLSDGPAMVVSTVSALTPAPPVGRFQLFEYFSLFPFPFSLFSRFCLLRTHAGINHPVENIHDEVDDDVDGGDEERHALNDRIIALEDR